MLSRPSKLSCNASLLLFALMVGVPVAGASAQCATQWLPGQGVRGTDGVVRATTVWDPDGPGPMHSVLVVGGEFTIAGGVVANGIAIHDPASGSWSALGSGMSIGTYLGVFALTTLPNGDLVAGGWFATAGGVSVNNIARWNGTSWSPLGSGIDISFFGGVHALKVLPNGDLVAGGAFFAAGGVSASNIARWNGASWSPLGSGVNGSGVLALTTLPNGDLVAGGSFTTAGGVSANSIARWDGTSWSALGSGMSSSAGSEVSALTTLANGDLVAGGYFTTAGGVSANHIARWNGSNWSALGSGVSPAVQALTTLANGDLVAGGGFLAAGGVSANYIARWDGTNWSTFGSGMGSGAGRSVRALATLPNGNLVAGGDFSTAGSASAWNIARWDGTSWSALGSGTNSIVFALTTLANGDLVAGGHFTTAGGVNADRIARWDGTSWSALGSGMSSSGSGSIVVRALTTLPNGDLVAGGGFTIAGGVSANNIARWDGTNWSALGSGMGGQTGPVYALTVLPNGDLVAGGQFTTAGGVNANNIARWDGTSWSPLGSGLNGIVGALTTLPNGDLIAAGQFTTAGGMSANSIARWDGTNWSALGSGIPFGGVQALTALPNGDLVAAGYFATAGGVSVTNIARWNGTSWSALGSGFPLSCDALTTLPNGDLAAGGPGAVRRWDGASWSTLGSVMNAFGRVHALLTLANGDLVAGGDFTWISGVVSAYIAQLTTTCPPAVISSGTGCTGSGGPNVLTATTLPWAGSTFRSVATGMPANARAIGVFGLGTTSIPLSSILPQGVPGCTLLVSPDVLDLYIPTAGSAQTQIMIPNNTALVGVVFYQQVVPVEFGAGAVITAVTSTNRLVMVIGSF